MNKNIKIIAEIGINHNGSPEMAKKLIDASFFSGAGAIKFQYRNLNNAYSDNAKEIGDEMLSKEINRNYLDPLILLELSIYAKELGLEVGISFFDEKDINDFSDNIEIFDFFKIPSVELSNDELIDTLLSLNKMVYISLGAHDESEITNALDRLPSSGWIPMHCISNYPVTQENSRLGYIYYLKDKWGVDIGYSSHDDDWEVCILAMQMGVTVIERHITLDRKANGLDHSSSSTPDHFKKISKFAKNMPMLLLGNAPRVPNQGELLNRQNLGRSYYVMNDYKKGDKIQMSELQYRSPHTGLDKTNISEYISQPLQIDISSGSVVAKSYFERTASLSDDVIHLAKEMGLSLPVRLHDLNKIEKLFPIGAFEFHLSFDEVLSEIDLSNINPKNKYSIHLPDYINPTQLIDPFSKDTEQKELSIELLERTIQFAESLQSLTGKNVLVLGSFSIVHSGKGDFYKDYNSLFKSFLNRGVEVVPQWLPPIAWYFGGSIELDIMNNIDDVDYLLHNNMGVCMDVCHLILGRNFYNFSDKKIIKLLGGQIRHIHIADATGIDGEGMAIGEGDPENIYLIEQLLDYKCLKVIEVWQGHLNNGDGFRRAIIRLTDLYKNSKFVSKNEENK